MVKSMLLALQQRNSSNYCPNCFTKHLYSNIYWYIRPKIPILVKKILIFLSTCYIIFIL